MKRTAIQRRTRLRQRSRRRQSYMASTLRAEGVAHMLAVKGLPCIACGAPPPSYAHHVTGDKMPRRYITDDVEFYEHEYREAAKDKKQGSGGPHRAKDSLSAAVRGSNRRALDLYSALIDNGVAPEQARGVLPQDLMTAFTWSGTFGAFAKMCQLRLHPEAQVETRYVAQQVYAHLTRQFPVAAPLFVHGG
jgi:hypothetical protein